MRLGAFRSINDQIHAFSNLLVDEQPDGTGRLPWPGFDPTGDVPGWRRFGPAEIWLELRASRRMTVAATDRRRRLPRTPAS